MTMKTLALLVLIISSWPLFGGEIAEMYWKLPLTNRMESIGQKSSSNDGGWSTNHGITEIGIERTGCFGECPAYTFIFKSDGTFRYQGSGYVQRKGTFTGTVTEWEFNRLATFIRDSGYMALSNTYSAMITDLPTVYSTVVMNGKRKVISHYANAGPNKLWVIEELIDSRMREANWTEPPKTADKPK